MAGFYSSSSAQGDVLSTPYVQDPKFINYTESHINHANTMTYLNPASDHPHRTSISSVIDGGQNFHGLSLTLNTNMSSTTSSSKNTTYEFSNLHGNNQTCIGFAAPNNFEYNTYQYEQAGVANAVLKSKYLQATQQLLHELVSVREAVKRHESEKDLKVNESETSFVATTDANERRDLQNKLDKLLAMLDEVDKRYKQYYHQMQILVSSFDLGAGCGAAKPYTTLALKTISRHFRCLRDAVSGQIEATRKSLGEQDPGQGGVIPRLRYVDQQLRQQRALQQFGMLRHAWRPQRGLPENAVTVLRAWLFEHFLHPYPKDSEKSMLARQTGLTRGQVANWFINARVRLWKPMVEEMYKEEFSNAELNSNSSTENATKETGHKSWASEDDSERHDDSDTNAKTSLMSYQLQGLGSYKVDSRVSLALGLQRIEGAVENRMGTGLRSVLTDNGVGGGSVAEYSYLDSDNRPMFGNNNLTNDFVG